METHRKTGATSWKQPVNAIKKDIGLKIHVRNWYLIFSKSLCRILVEMLIENLGCILNIAVLQNSKLLFLLFSKSSLDGCSSWIFLYLVQRLFSLYIILFIVEAIW